MSKYYIAGSGIVGSVIAHELAEAGNPVIIYERRNHLGGNLFDYDDEYGIHVHKYGPHIFHTKEKRIYEYVSKYCRLKNFNLVCGSVIDGKCVTTSFDFSAVDTFFHEEAEIIKEHIGVVFKGKTSTTVLEMLECEDPYVQKFAQFLYDKDYKLYTAKQWGISPDEIDKQIFNRVPILFSYGSKYFDDEYQYMPEVGYMELINNLLDHENIETILNTNALDVFSIKDNEVYINELPCDGVLIYTGPIDELFSLKYGELPYRSLRFEWKHEKIDSFQEMPVVAYPQAKEYTRITEYKKLPVQQIDGTTYAIEYPLPYVPGQHQEPYYPVLTESSQQLFERYSNLADGVSGLICAGRLADFKYYNIDQAIMRALDIAAELLKKNGEN